VQELFNFISGLFVVLGVVFIILLAITYQLVNSKQTRENQKAAWKRLAETYNLRFNSDNNLLVLEPKLLATTKAIY
jgi:hypothetical protein